ncbi:hypothetical protein HELRODRAFT_157612 [Helobdella robusta]|uniref:Serpin domain-containing protein n=1 Tax=Helobdella robusta TaxID=6412 RepID=T1EMD8_HELRO|nr:hypothetical protein HELRODRAFT_157612 [Helobdella robusta]ESN95879.1 hypothetical protein HELRODRAFT_157612 [Helobdella robusta]
MRVDVVNTNLEFGISLYKELVAGNPQENVFFSPVSLMFALGLTLLGSRGHLLSFGQQYKHTNDISFFQINCYTCYQLKSVMKIGIMMSADVHQGLLEMKSFLENTKSPQEIHIANRLFFEQSELWLKVLLTVVRNTTEVVRIINGAPASVAKINRLGLSILVNAIYFEGKWKTKFERTESGEFKINPDQILELPYENQSMSFVILLPNLNETTLENVEKILESGVLLEINERLTETKLKIRLTKFSLTNEPKVMEKLQKLGLTDLFIEGKADLYNMNMKNDLYVSKLVHKAFIEVNEGGTVAAAATGGQPRARSAIEYVSFNADYPFIFLIKDNNFQTVFFMGKFVKP